MNSDFDYDAWVKRAVAFTDRCRRLPGRVEVEVQVEPPMSESAVERLAANLPLGIPGPLRRFLSRGSASCEISYLWHAEGVHDSLGRTDMAALASVPWASILPTKTYMVGGASLCNASQFHELQAGCQDFANLSDNPEEERDLWRRSVPFLFVPNGDCLALDVETHPVDPPVAYLSHEGGGTSFMFSPTFESFLTDWERLCYMDFVWLLEEDDLFDPKTRSLTSNVPKARAIQLMFERSFQAEP